MKTSTSSWLNLLKNLSQETTKNQASLADASCEPLSALVLLLKAGGRSDARKLGGALNTALGLVA